MTRASRAAAGATLLLAAACLAGAAAAVEVRGGTMKIATPDTIELPAPPERGAMSLEEALAARRSVRRFESTVLSARQIGHLLWAAQGVTSRDGLRTAPSAGALHPLEAYVVTAEGLHHYEPRHHRLIRRSERDLRDALAAAALGQETVALAPAVFVLTGVYERSERKYGSQRAPRYVHLEAGHAAQNLLLGAVALGLGGTPVGAFDDASVRSALGLPAGEQPLYLIPVGVPR